MKTRLLIVAAVILASLTTLMLTTGGTGQNSIVVVDALNVVAAPADYAGKELRMRGFVKAGSILRYGDKADFIVEQEGREIPVHFNGATILPDTFADGAPVRVDGHLKPDGETGFVATKVEAKCASKYEATYAEKDHPSVHPAAIPMQSGAAAERRPGY
jgi:cytochrome c-type biogenesis protein CcmE